MHTTRILNFPRVGRLARGLVQVVLLMCVGLPPAMATINNFDCFADSGVGTISCENPARDTLSVEKNYASLLGSMYVSVAAAGGTTDITFNEVIHNYTGVPWSGFTFQLGEEFGGVLLYQAIFSVPIAVYDPAVPPSPYLTVLFANPLAAGGSFNVSLSASISNVDGALFDLSQTALEGVPAPAPLALLLPGLIGLWHRRRRSAD